MNKNGKSLSLVLAILFLLFTLSTVSFAVTTTDTVPYDEFAAYGLGENTSGDTLKNNETGAAVTAASAAAQGGEFVFTVDYNLRDTDISEISDVIDADSEENTVNRNTYIAILSVLLVIALVVLFVSLRKAHYKTDEELAAELAAENEKQ